MLLRRSGHLLSGGRRQLSFEIFTIRVCQIAVESELSKPQIVVAKNPAVPRSLALLARPARLAISRKRCASGALLQAIRDYTASFHHLSHNPACGAFFSHHSDSVACSSPPYKARYYPYLRLRLSLRHPSRILPGSHRETPTVFRWLGPSG